MFSFLIQILFLTAPIAFSEEEISRHEFHLSKCDIDYSPDESTFQISISLFIDDLELALSEMGHDSLKICTSKEAATAEIAIMSYLEKHLKIVVDGDLYGFEWVGKEPSEDLAAVWCYLQISNVFPKQYIEVENDALMHLFEDQQNLVRLQYTKKKKSFFLFDKTEYKGKLQIKDD